MLMSIIFTTVFTRPGPWARPSRGINVCVCLFVCVFVCLLVPPKPGPLGTFWIPWTCRYFLDTLDL